jgi:hypothetical protein
VGHTPVPRSPGFAVTASNAPPLDVLNESALALTGAHEMLSEIA